MHSLTDVTPATTMDCTAAHDPNLFVQNPISVSLEDASLWHLFNKEGTEMIITKSGRRMFPQCKLRFFGLHPHMKYIILIDFVPVDNNRYKWNKNQWEANGKAEMPPPYRKYIHPDSPALGSHWMKDIVSFQKLKLTNNTLDQQNKIILHSMHRYKPRFHVIQSDDIYNLPWGLVQIFIFPETQFTAVTAYQNEKITKLKIDYNPFAKGFRDKERSNKRNDLLKLASQSPSGQKRKQEESPSEAQNVRSKVACVKEEASGSPTGAYTQWIPDHEQSQNVAPNVTGCQSQEQVTLSASNVMYKSPNRQTHQALSSTMDVSEPQGRSITTDFAAVQENSSFQFPVPHTLQPVQDRLNVMNPPIETPVRQCLRAPVYNPYGTEQWMVPTQGQYRPMGYSYGTDFSTQRPAAHPHNNISDWDQIPRFQYACW